MAPLVFGRIASEAHSVSCPGSFSANEGNVAVMLPILHSDESPRNE